MKFSASSAELLKALTTVGGAVPTKSTLPILECILFERNGDDLGLSATDLEISIVQHVAVTFENDDTDDTNETARVAVPAKRLVDTLRALPDLPILFSSDAEMNITLQTDQGTYKMVGHDGADYPALPELTGQQRFETQGTLLRRTIAKTSFAVSRDALRPAMMGVYFQIQSDSGKAVATDGHRLVMLTVDGMTSEEPLNFIVPEKAMTLAGRIVPEGTCSIWVDEGYVGFDFGTSRVFARLIDEAYPNYEAVIPVGNDRRMVVNRNAILAAVKRVGLYSSSMTNQIRLSLRPNQVEISAEDIERSSEAHELIQCEYENEPMVIGFNSVYLNEVLSHIDSEDIVFDFSTPNRAGVVTPNVQEDGEEMMMLIMPVMLNTYA